MIYFELENGLVMQWNTECKQRKCLINYKDFDERANEKDKLTEAHHLVWPGKMLHHKKSTQSPQEAAFSAVF